MSSSASLPRLVVLLSGSGSNLQALIDATRSGRLPARIVKVIANRRQAYGLVRAEHAGIPTEYLLLKPYLAMGGRAEYEAALAERVAAAQPDVVVLAGWMHIFGPAFVARFAGQLINLHPALPGSFPGAHAIADAFAAFERGEVAESGCMVHEVTDELDSGRVIASASVPFLPGETLAAFEERIHAAEHEVIVAAVAAKLAEQGCAPPIATERTTATETETPHGR